MVCIKDYEKRVYFISSSDFNAYLREIKVLLSTVKRYRIFSLVTNTICIFFTAVNRGCLDNLVSNLVSSRKILKCTPVLV